MGSKPAPAYANILWQKPLTNYFGILPENKARMAKYLLNLFKMFLDDIFIIFFWFSS